MAYGGNPTASNTDGVRLLVGDISASTATELLADADYTFFLTQGTFYIAAQLAANSLAAKAAAAASDGVTRKKVGDLEIEVEAGGLQDAQTYQMMAKKFGRMAARQISPYAGGITHSDKDNDRQDSDVVEPSFYRGLMDNPASVGFALSESTSA